MEQKNVKLIKSDNGEYQFAILLDQVIGKGAFGVVRRAYDLANKDQKLAVKIIPVGDGKNVPAIEKELKVIRELPDHPNLVRVRPIKCFSKSNYYIFMEYCDEGTLLDEMLNKDRFTEQEICNVFYQLISGYKLLFDKKILHQDLKPENVLVRKGKYKLADFGLSIFYEGYVFDSKREGTLNYMAPQKFVINYTGNPKCDVYALGVILFKMIVGNHPYLKEEMKKWGKIKEFKEFLDNAKLQIPQGFHNRFSLRFQTLLGIVIRMIGKTDRSRISFEEVWNYTQTNQNFVKFRQNEQKQMSKKQSLSEQFKFVFSNVSKVLTIPFGIAEEQEQKLKHQMKEKQILEQKQEEQIAIGKIYEYILSNRMLIFYLDRLARRIIVRQLETKLKTQQQQRVLFLIMHFNRFVLSKINNERKNPKIFKIIDWRKFLNRPQSEVLDLVRKDDEYIEESLCDMLAENKKLSKSELKEMFEIHKANSQSKIVRNLYLSLVQLFKQKALMIEVKNKKELLMLNFLVEFIEIISNLQKEKKSSQELQSIFKDIESCSIQKLELQVQNKCRKQAILYNKNLGEWEQIQQEAEFI